MDILKIAIYEAGSVGKLASTLGVKSNVVSNWRLRNNLPHSWATVLRLKYARAIKEATKQPA